MIATRSGVAAAIGRALVVMLMASILGSLIMTAARADEALRLAVSENGRYLVDGNGEPFFWLGDTGWAMFSSLTANEAEFYLENRRQKGFNVIQCVIAHWSRSDVRTTPDGERPWTEDDPAIPNPGYLEHMDRILKLAEEKGIVLAMLPVWGDFVTRDKIITQDNAYHYGHELGRYYRDTPNIVWVLGGDQLPTGYEGVFRELARGLSEGDGGSHLITYHPRGGGHSSSEFFHQEDWLNFNMIQSSHSIDYPNHENVLRDYKKRPAKPTLDGEPRYENVIHGLAREGLRIDDHDVRKAAYGAVLSGALGHTYGCNGVFQFWVPGDEPRYDPNMDWKSALDLQGAFDMGHLKRLMLASPWPKLVPDQSVVVRGSGTGRTYAPAARSEDGTFIYAYVPERQAVTVDMSKISGEGAKASWYDPRTGKGVVIGEFENAGTQQFLPPTGPGDPDYVLVVASAGPDVTPPAITDVITHGDPTRLFVRFSEPVEQASASSADNYKIEPGITVADANLDEAGRMVTLITSLLANGAKYTLSVSNVTDRAVKPNPIADGARQEFVFLTKPARVARGLQALYVFEGEGAVVKDTSLTGEPLNLVLPDIPGVTRIPGGLSIGAPVLIATEAPATRLTTACQETNEVTIEAWIKPANLTQGGPARIVTLSVDTGTNRNFTLGQEGGAYHIRFKTTETGDSYASTGTPAGSLTTELSHVVYTRDASGVVRVHINGDEVARGQIRGDLSNWADHRLALANELTDDRPWLGEIHLVAIYDHALTPAGILQNFKAGPGLLAKP